MYRIYKVYSSYNQYLHDQMNDLKPDMPDVKDESFATQDEQQFIKNRISQNLRESLTSSYMAESMQEHKYIKEMISLREEVLIKKSLMYFILPAFILGVIGFIFPYVFAFLPSHLCQVCACMFFCRSWGHPFLNLEQPRSSYYSIVLINVTSMTVT